MKNSKKSKRSPKTTHRIIVTQGDPAGVGWQLFLKLLKNKSNLLKTSEIDRLNEIIVIGDALSSQKREIKKYFSCIEIPNIIHKTHISNSARVLEKLESEINSFKTQKPVFLILDEIDIQPGKPTLLSAQRSYEYIISALNLWMYIHKSSLLTLPVSKEQIMNAGINFRGHTEVLQKKSTSPAFMCMYHPELSVLPLTNHIPLKQVGSKIKKINYEALGQALSFFLNFFNPKKPVGMLGLNPHAGEGGHIGKEEFFLKEKLEILKRNQILVEGLFPADGFFTPSMRKDFSLAVCCYHDQALIPFKALFGTEGINITLNLPKLRVSPDHGPAFPLANSPKADITSILNSLLFCFKYGNKWVK